MAYDTPTSDPYAQQNGITDPNNPAGAYPPPSAPPPVNSAAPRAAYTPQMRDEIVRGWTNSSYDANKGGIQAYLSSLGERGSGWTVNRDDKVVDPNGRIYDWIGNVNTADAQKRSGYTTDSRYANVTGATSGKTGKKTTTTKTTTTAPGTPAAPTAPTAPTRDPRWDALYEELMTRSKQGLAVDRNDPIIRAQADAFNANTERARRQDMARIAEKSGPLANLRGEQRMGAERAGQAGGAFEAELMGRELTARRQEIADALDDRRMMLTDEQQRALTKELALMDDAIKRLSLKQQDKQFGKDLDFRYAGLRSGEDMESARLGLQAQDRANYWDSVYRGVL